VANPLPPFIIPQIYEFVKQFFEAVENLLKVRVNTPKLCVGSRERSERGAGLALRCYRTFSRKACFTFI